jgi:hypothetical protein
MSTLLYKLAAQVWQGLGNNARARVMKLKEVLPTRLTEGVKEAIQQQTLNAAVQRILASPPDKIPDDDTLQQLTTGWGMKVIVPADRIFERSQGRCCL